MIDEEEEANLVKQMEQGFEGDGKIIGAAQAQANYQQMKEQEEAKRELEELEEGEENMYPGLAREGAGSQNSQQILYRSGQKRPREQNHNNELLEMD